MDNLELIKLVRQGDKEARDKLVDENIGLIWSIVRRYGGRGYDMDELFQIGSVGLLKAIDKFELDYGVMFSTYAVPMILGEIKRFIRDDGIIRVSRSLKENQVRINLGISELTLKLNREPTINELSKYLEMDRTEIVMTIESMQEVESIYKTINQNDGNEMYLVDKLSDNSSIGASIYGSEDEKEKLINHMVLKEAMNELDTREKELIYRRYFKNETQMEVAKIFGVSQVQVCRLEKKILYKIKKRFE